MNFVQKLKIYHGSPYKFDSFNQEGLGFDKEVGMAITAGFYFTTDKEEALAYAQGGYLYETELVFDLNYKANKDPELILDNKGEPNHGMRFVSVSERNDVVSDLHRGITATQIKSLLKKGDYKNKVIDHYDVDVNDRFEVERTLTKIAHDYARIFKDDLLHGFNCLGNDWFDDKDSQYILNQEFSKKTGILAFDKQIGDVVHFCFLDGDLIPKFKMYDLSVELEKELESGLALSDKGQGAVLKR